MAELFKRKQGKFAQTKIGKIAGAVVPEILEAADNMFTGGKITEAIGAVRDAIQGKADNGDEVAKQAITDLDIRMEELKQELQKLYLEEMRLDVQDRDSARSMRNEFTRAGKIDWEHFIVNMVGIIAFFAVVGYLLFRTVPQENREFIIHILGIFEGIVVGIYMFHNGSSSGSRLKDKAAIQNQSK